MASAYDFLKFALERHKIFLRRSAGIEQKYWTCDPILKKFRFTNVFRELDATTLWFKEHVREPLKDDTSVLLATVAFRWFNKTETGRVLLWGEGPNQINLFKNWNSNIARERLRKSGPPWVTGSYIIKTPDGMDKLDGVLWCIDKIAPHCQQMAEDLLNCEHGDMRLEQFHKWLMEFPFLGHFMAYEIVTDLRWTSLLDHAPDINTWANPGPGARRGLNRINGRDLNKSVPVDQLLVEMRELLPKMREAFEKLQKPHEIEMREVEHTLCEFDKYERVRLGEGRPRQVFKCPTSK